MTLDLFKENLEQMKKIIREIHIFTNQLEQIKNLESKVSIESGEKKLLTQAIISLTNQLKILNNSLPEIIENINFYKQLETETPLTIPAISAKPSKSKKLIQVKYKPADLTKRISLTISDKDRKDFLENLSKSALSVRQLEKYKPPKPAAQFGKPNTYAILSNKYFKKISNNLVSKGYFNKLNRDLRKINSPFVLGTYISMILFTITLVFIFSIFLVILLLFFKMGITYPFFTPVEESILLRFAKTFWLIIVLPLVTAFLMYFYPPSEAKNLGGRINQELPFVVIHMSAISTSGIEPTSIFKILLKSEEYKYSNIEFKKLMNLINFHGKDLVTALKDVAHTSPSQKLSELLNGLATTITSGGNLRDYLNKHAETLLFDYKLEKDKLTKNSETFMDIYIAVVIAAPMILMLMFVIMGSLGTLGSFLGLSTQILSLIIILIVGFINIIFLSFLKLKQPTT